MKYALLLLAMAVVPAFAQTAPPTYPSAPSIVATKQVGWSVVWTWNAPTQNEDGSAITGALTYDVYMSTGGAFTELTSGLSALKYTETNLPLGTPCIYVVAEEGGTNTIPSVPSSMVCVQVNAAPVVKIQPNPPSSVSGY